MFFCCASMSMFFWASTHPMTISVAMGRPPSKFLDVFLWLIFTQIPYLFLKMQCPCKCYVCCCGPIAIQTPCAHGDGNLSQQHPNFVPGTPEIPCVVLGRSAFTFHVCRFDSISIFVIMGQHPPNDYDYICRYGILLTQNVKFLWWIIAGPGSLILLACQHPFNFYIAPNFVLSVALNSMLFWADAFVIPCLLLRVKPLFKFHVCCCESMSIQTLYVL